MTLLLWCFLYAVSLIYSAHGKGCVLLDSYSFDKVTSKFEASLIKFDTAYPYGSKHDAYEAVCESTYSSPELLVGEVQVKDYGEKDNQDLAKKYDAESNDFPVVKLFVKGKEPVTFQYTGEKDFTTDALKKFVRENSNIYIGLLGCLEEFDKLASQFSKTKCPEERKKILEQAEALWNKAQGNRENKSAETYVKVMRKVLEKGNEFIVHENDRVSNIINGKISAEKKSEMRERMNILVSFEHHDEL